MRYFNPHSFRNTLTTLGEQKCTTAEEFKAWSQNLGHENVSTTFTSYGEVQPQRQADIFKELKKTRSNNNQSTDEIIKATVKEMLSQKMVS